MTKLIIFDQRFNPDGEVQPGLLSGIAENSGLHVVNGIFAPVWRQQELDSYLRRNNPHMLFTV